MLLTPSALAQQGALNILLIGVDSADLLERSRSDSMILLKLDPHASEIRMVSFLRDLYVSVPGIGKMRLNAAYAHGGEALLKETITQNFGVAIDRTAAVSYPLLAELVDELGGVEIDIAERELNQLNKLIAEYNASWGFSGGTFSRSGLQRLDGRQALCYSRIRKIDSDFQRSSRQQALLTAMFREAAQLPAWQLLKLAVRHLSRIQTDLSLSDLLALLPMASRLSETAIHTACVPFEGTYRDETISGSQVLVPDLERCREKLSAFLP